MRDLSLTDPIYQSTAAYGHFGRTDLSFKWEQVKQLTIPEGLSA